MLVVRSILCWIVACLSPFFFFFNALRCYIQDPASTVEAHMQDGSRLWARLLLKITGITIDIKNPEALKIVEEIEKPIIVVSNHNSVIDVLVLLHSLPLRCVYFAKSSIFVIPGYGWYMWAAGHIPVNRNNARSAYHSLKAAGRKLKEGTSLVIFPEGSRSTNGEIQRFKKGFTRLAEMSQAPILPISIKGTNKIIKKGSMLLRPSKVILNIGVPVYTVSESLETNEERSNFARNIQNKVTSMLKES